MTPHVILILYDEHTKQQTHNSSYKGGTRYDSTTSKKKMSHLSSILQLRSRCRNDRLPQLYEKRERTKYLGGS